MEEEISQKIRDVRKKQNMTLKELSRRTGLSVSFLSQFERGVSSVTLVSLKKISDALQVSLSEVFAEQEQNTAYVYKRGMEQGMWNWEKNYASYTKLSGTFEGRKMESFLLKMEPLRDDFVPCTHEGEEFIYVLEGCAVFTVDGVAYEVCEGESIHYPSTLLHKITNPLNRELSILCIITPPLF